jgi:hypothetical protein
MAYFLRRKPAVGFWGSEWAGDYDRQYRLTLVELPKCLAEASLGCLEELIAREGLEVDYIVLPGSLFSGEIEVALKASRRWRETYQNSGYRVWERVSQADLAFAPPFRSRAALGLYRPALSTVGK